MPSSYHRKKKWGNLLLLLFSVLFALALSEILLRVLNIPPDSWTVPPPSTIDPYKENPYMIKCKPFLHSHIPGAVYTQKFDTYEVLYRINSRGFRGPEVSSLPPCGMKRLLIIGDSMVEGAGVDFSNTFPTLLNQALTPLRWEVIDAGAQGASPIYFAANLPRYLDLHPDAVLLVLFDNDIGDDYERSCFYKTAGVTPDAGSNLLKDRTSPLFTPRLGKLLKRVFGMPSADSIWPSEFIRRFEEVFRRHQADNPVFQPGFKYAIGNHVTAKEEWDIAWEISQDYLDLFTDSIRSRKVPVLATLLSLGYSMSKATPQQKCHAEMFYDAVKKWSFQRKIPFLSLTDGLRAELNVEGRPAILFPIDGHLNEKGHRLAAQILKPWLMEQLSLLPSATREPF